MEHCIRHTAHNARGAERAVHTVHELGMAAKRARQGKTMTLQLLSINESISFRILSEVHSVIDKGNRTVHFSTYSTVNLLFLHSSHFYYQKSKDSATQTSQNKKKFVQYQNTVGGQEFGCSRNMCKNLVL